MDYLRDFLDNKFWPLFPPWLGVILMIIGLTFPFFWIAYLLSPDFRSTCDRLYTITVQKVVSLRSLIEGSRPKKLPLFPSVQTLLMKVYKKPVVLQYDQLFLEHLNATEISTPREASESIKTFHVKTKCYIVGTAITPTGNNPEEKDIALILPVHITGRNFLFHKNKSGQWYIKTK